MTFKEVFPTGYFQSEYTVEVQCDFEDVPKVSTRLESSATFKGMFLMGTFPK